MRTVTFSDPGVAAYLSDNFVCAWFNRGPGFDKTPQSKEYRTEEWIFGSSFESYPTRNICTFFLEPDGRVFTYAAGYHCPELFLEIAKTATALRKNPRNLARRLSERAGQLARDYSAGMHRSHAARIGFTPSAGRAPSVKWCGTATYRGKKHAHGPTCAMALQQGFAHLQAVYGDFAKRRELPRLTEVQSSYLSGNPFTEESGLTATLDDSLFASAREAAAAPAAPAPVDRRPSLLRAADAEIDVLQARFEEINAVLCTAKIDDRERYRLQDALLALSDRLLAVQRRRANLAR